MLQEVLSRMRKEIKILGIVLITLLFVAVSLPAAANPAQTSRRVHLNTTKVVLSERRTAKLRLINASGKISWHSTRPSIARVNKRGQVTARKAGEAVVYAKWRGKKYSCRIQVLNNVFICADTPASIRPFLIDNSIQFFIQRLAYRGRGMECRGIFTNTGDVFVQKVEDFRLRLYSGKKIIARGVFNLKTSLPSGGYQYFALYFLPGDVTSQKWDLRRIPVIKSAWQYAGAGSNFLSKSFMRLH